VISIDSSSAEAPYDQVKRQISDQVRAGELQPGDKLPPVRQLAAELGLSPNTVAKAYRELEAGGVLDTRGRAGTFVSTANDSSAARNAAREFVERARALGLNSREAVLLVEAVFRAGER